MTEVAAQLVRELLAVDDGASDSQVLIALLRVRSDAWGVTPEQVDAVGAFVRAETRRAEDELRELKRRLADERRAVRQRLAEAPGRQRRQRSHLSPKTRPSCRPRKDAR